jgi:hypothetical protein
MKPKNRRPEFRADWRKILFDVALRLADNHPRYGKLGMA